MTKTHYQFDDEKWPLGLGIKSPDDLPPTEREIYSLLDLIVAEWESDPMSVRCFDSRIVERSKRAVAPYRALKRKAR